MDLFALRRRDHGTGAGDGVSAERFKKINGCILGICACIAWLISDLALMLEFVGVWSTMALAFVLPCAFHMELRRRQEGVSWLSMDNALHLALLVLGVVVTVVGTVQVLSELGGGSVDEDET